MHALGRTILGATAGLAAVFGGVGAAAAVPAPPVSMTADPGSLDLGSVVIGAASAGTTVIGTTNADARDWAGVQLATPPGAITGANASEFAIDSTPTGACIAAQGLFPADTCTTRVVFTPTSAGTKTASLTISATATYNISAVASTPCAEFAAGSVGIAGGFAPACAITIPLTATALTPLTPPAGAVSITPTPSTVRTGHTLKVVVTTSNTGEATMEQAITVLAVPRGFRVVNAGGGTATSAGVSWTNATIAGGASETRTVTLRVLSATARTADLTTSLAATGVTSSAQAKVKITVPPRRKAHRRAAPVTG